MISRTPGALLGVASGALLAIAPAVDAYTWYVFGSQVVTWNAGQSVRHLSPVTFDPTPPNDTTFNLILGAMGLWNIVPATDFEYFYAQDGVEYGVAVDGVSTTLAVPASSLDPGVLGVTFLVNDGPFWLDMDIAFADVPDGIGWNFDANPSCDVVENPAPVNGYSFLLAATHELGHALGLGHDPIGTEAPGTPWFLATMNPRYPGGVPVGDQDIVELHTDDRNGLRFLYPPSGPSGPSLTDLANVAYVTGPEIGKVVPAGVSPLSVGPGGTVSLDCLIENFGTTSEVFVRQGFYLSADPVIETTDTLLGFVEWDIAFEDAFEFGVDVDMPADIAPGAYSIGSILDDTDAVAEAFEDNNTVVYCDQLVVEQLPPAINTMGQENIFAGVAYTGPVPTLTLPLNMGPATWSIDNPRPGMTINPATGVMTWPDPVPSQFLYVIIYRAQNGSGSSTQQFFLGVAPCEGDVDASRVVDINDIAYSIFRLGASGTPGTVDGDADGNGVVDVVDLAYIVFRLGTDCTGAP